MEYCAYEIGHGYDAMKEYGSDGEGGLLSTIHQNYFTQLCKLNDEERKNIEITAVGTELDGRFNHTRE